MSFHHNTRVLVYHGRGCKCTTCIASDIIQGFTEVQLPDGVNES